MKKNKIKGLMRETKCCTGCEIKNIAVVSYYYTNINNEKETSSVTTNQVSTCVKNPILNSIKIICHDYGVPGDMVTYNVIAINNGNVPIGAITTYETLPEGITYSRVNEKGCFFIDEEGNKSSISVWDQSQAPFVKLNAVEVLLNAGESVVFSYYVKVNEVFNYNLNPITGVSYLSGIDNDGDFISAKTNDISLSINNANIEVEKFPKYYEANCNESLSYTISLLNTGNITAHNVCISDGLDSNFTINLEDVRVTSGDVILPSSISYNSISNVIKIWNLEVAPNIPVDIVIPGKVSCCD